MVETLETAELLALVKRVFAPDVSTAQRGDHTLALLVDLPDDELADNDDWRLRRALAADWSEKLAAASAESGISGALFGYRNVRCNNADLPESAWRLEPGARPPMHADALDPAQAVPFAELFASQRMVLAMTELSATAPLKLAAKEHGFRAATMPGFGPKMIPALRLDYGEVDRRVRLLAGLLDDAVRADFEFCSTAAPERRWSLALDLRYRTAHASGGLIKSPGQAGNLPSGEAYIVPYEGEVAGAVSGSVGELPVQHAGEIVVYRIVENRAIEVLGDGPQAQRERAYLAREPAYGNLAELGLGVLSDFGVRPIGELLLDEKLGLHIAFGRSDHFGGQIGAKDFSCAEAVVHIDRVYLEETMPLLRVPRVDLVDAAGTVTPLLREGRYTVDFS